MPAGIGLLLILLTLAAEAWAGNVSSSGTRLLDNASCPTVARHDPIDEPMFRMDPALGLPDRVLGLKSKGGLLRNWQVFTGWHGMWSPVCGDWDPATPGLETIVTVSCVEGYPPYDDVFTLIFAVHADGSLIPGWGPLRIDEGMSHNAPAFGDLDGDGDLELVLTIDEEPFAPRMVYALEADGSFAPGHWPVRLIEVCAASPVLADLDGDGLLEVLIPCKDHKLWIFNHDGTPFRPDVWPKELGGILYRSPAVGRFARNGDPKIVIGCEETATGRGIVYVLNPDGTSHSPAWPRYIDDRTVFTPAIADIDQNGEAEIVFGGGNGIEVPNHLIALRSDGSMVEGWPRRIWEPDERYPPGGYAQYVAVADLDPAYPGREIIMAGDMRERIYAWHADGTDVRGWPHPTSDSAYVGNAVAIADVDGEPGLDVVVGEGYADYAPHSRRLFLLHADGQDFGGSPVDVGGFVQTSASLADIDLDGKIEILVPVGGPGMLECFEMPEQSTGVSSLVWPTQQHDFCRTGFYPEFPAAHAVPETELWAGGSDSRLLLRPGPMEPGAVNLELTSAIAGLLDLRIYDVNGRVVTRLDADASLVPGVRRLSVDTSAWPRGVYVARAGVRTPRGPVVATTKFVSAR